MRVGLMDREVQLQHRSLGTANAYGEQPVTWSTYATVWAQRADFRGREYAAIKQVAAEAETRVRMHYRDDVLVTDRAIMDGVTYEVVAPPAEIGRRAGLELLLRVVT